MDETRSPDNFAKFMSYVRHFNDLAKGVHNIVLGVGALAVLVTLVIIPNWEAFAAAGLFVVAALPHLPIEWLKNKYVRTAWGVGVVLVPFLVVIGIVGISLGATQVMSLKGVVGENAARNEASHLLLNSSIITILALWGLQQPAIVIANERLDRLEKAFMDIGKALVDTSKRRESAD